MIYQNAPAIVLVAQLQAQQSADSQLGKQVDILARWGLSRIPFFQQQRKVHRVNFRMTFVFQNSCVSFPLWQECWLLFGLAFDSLTCLRQLTFIQPRAPGKNHEALLVTPVYFLSPRLLSLPFLAGSWLWVRAKGSGTSLWKFEKKLVVLVSQGVQVPSKGI